jgi:hypothetical protein
VSDKTAMSETPRTDAAEETVVTSQGRRPLGFVSAELARTLERELSACRAKLEEVQSWYDEAMKASNEAGFVGVDAAATIRELARLAKENVAAPGGGSQPVDASTERSRGRAHAVPSEEPISAVPVAATSPLAPRESEEGLAEELDQISKMLRVASHLEDLPTLTIANKLMDAATALRSRSGRT